MLTIQALLWQMRISTVFARREEKHVTYQQPAANVKESRYFRLVDIFKRHIRGIGYPNIAKSTKTFKMPLTIVSLP
jgi:hypothetical protein